MNNKTCLFVAVLFLCFTFIGCGKKPHEHSYYLHIDESIGSQFKGYQCDCGDRVVDDRIKVTLENGKVVYKELTDWGKDWGEELYFSLCDIPSEDEENYYHAAAVVRLIYNTGIKTQRIEGKSYTSEYLSFPLRAKSEGLKEIVVVNIDKQVVTAPNYYWNVNKAGVSFGFHAFYSVAGNFQENKDYKVKEKPTAEENRNRATDFANLFIEQKSSGVFLKEKEEERINVILERTQGAGTYQIEQELIIPALGCGWYKHEEVDETFEWEVEMHVEGLRVSKIKLHIEGIYPYEGNVVLTCDWEPTDGYERVEWL